MLVVHFVYFSAEMPALWNQSNARQDCRAGLHRMRRGIVEVVVCGLTLTPSTLSPERDPRQHLLHLKITNGGGIKFHMSNILQDDNSRLWYKIGVEE